MTKLLLAFRFKKAKSILPAVFMSFLCGNYPGAFPFECDNYDIWVSVRLYHQGYSLKEIDYMQEIMAKSPPSTQETAWLNKFLETENTSTSVKVPAKIRAHAEEGTRWYILIAAVMPNGTVVDFTQDGQLSDVSLKLEKLVLLPDSRGNMWRVEMTKEVVPKGSQPQVK